MWEPPLHQGHWPGRWDVHGDDPGQLLGCAGQGTGYPQRLFFRGCLGLDTGLTHSWARPVDTWMGICFSLPACSPGERWGEEKPDLGSAAMLWDQLNTIPWVKPTFPGLDSHSQC